MHTEGEVAGAHVRRRGSGSRSPCRPWAPARSRTSRPPTRHGRNWFQLYMWKDRDRSDGPRRAGRPAPASTPSWSPSTYPVAGARLRDQRNGMTIPPVDHAEHRPGRDPTPGLVDQLPDHRATGLRQPRPAGAEPSPNCSTRCSTRPSPTRTSPGSAASGRGRSSSRACRPSRTPRRLADAGVDAITLSNHGGRQLDRAPIPFHLLPHVVREVGTDLEVHLDTGIMSGADIVASVALGARFTMIGRAYLYGLMAGGEAGVDRALDDPDRADHAHHAPARRGLARGAQPQPRHPARAPRARSPRPGRHPMTHPPTDPHSNPPRKAQP